MTEDKKEEIEDLVCEVRDASYKAVRWSYLGAGNPANRKKEGRHEDVERYGAFAIDLGLNDELNTDLNMSEAGRLRREDLNRKADAKSKFEQYAAKFRGGEEKKSTEPGLTLKDHKK